MRAKNFKLTSSHMHLGKAIAWQSKKTIAVECMKDDAVRKYILLLVGKIVHAEMKKLCSGSVQSVLLNSDPATLKFFKWQTLKSELTIHAPILKGVLESTMSEVKIGQTLMLLCVCVWLFWQEIGIQK